MSGKGFMRRVSVSLEKQAELAARFLTFAAEQQALMTEMKAALASPAGSGFMVLLNGVMDSGNLVGNTPLVGAFPAREFCGVVQLAAQLCETQLEPSETPRARFIEAAEKEGVFGENAGFVTLVKGTVVFTSVAADERRSWTGAAYVELGALAPFPDVVKIKEWALNVKTCKEFLAYCVKANARLEEAAVSSASLTFHADAAAAAASDADALGHIYAGEKRRRDCDSSGLVVPVMLPAPVVVPFFGHADDMDHMYCGEDDKDGDDGEDEEEEDEDD